MSYERLYSLSVDDYRMPEEKKAFAAIEKVPLLDELAGAYLKLVLEATVMPEVEGDSYRVTEKTCARLYELYALCAARLDIANPPPLFMKSSYEYNAAAYGGNKPMIVLNSAVAESFSDAELMFILGHELGHVKGRHVIYSNMLSQLKYLIRRIPSLGDALELGFALALMHWQRLQEYTADRAGMIACADPDAAVAAIGRLMGAAEIPGIQIDTASILAQADSFDQELDNFISQAYSALLIMEMNHPWAILRARELYNWNASGAFESVVRAHMQPC